MGRQEKKVGRHKPSQNSAFKSVNRGPNLNPCWANTKSGSPPRRVFINLIISKARSPHFPFYMPRLWAPSMKPDRDSPVSMPVTRRTLKSSTKNWRGQPLELQQRAIFTLFFDEHCLAEVVIKVRPIMNRMGLTREPSKVAGQCNKW